MTWGKILFENKPRMDAIYSILASINKAGKPYYPAEENVLEAFKECPWDNLKVVWVGQDPYHDGKATGLSMGVTSTSIPPTLRILNESLKQEYDREIKDFTLKSWANQGVLLLNAALTVEKSKPGSHSMLWAPHIFRILQNIHDLKKDIIWVALGKNAQETLSAVPTIKKELTVIAPHPMVAIYGGDINKFTSHKVFTQINSKLKDLGKEEILF